MTKSSNSFRKKPKKSALPPRNTMRVKKGKAPVKPRQPVRQRYTRFKVAVCKNDVTPAQARKDLIGKAGSTAKTYRGNLSALSDFVKSRRGESNVDLLTVVEDEFILFLYEWKQQGKGSAQGVWSSLLNLFRQNGVKKSFLDDDDVRKAVEGAAANFYPVNKGVVNETQNGMLNDFIEKCSEEKLGHCTWCRAKDVKSLRKRIRLAKDFMRGVPIRPGNLKDLQKPDVMDHVSPPQVHVRNPKVKGKDKEIRWVGEGAPTIVPYQIWSLR